jgi:hypothetical protein
MDREDFFKEAADMLDNAGYSVEFHDDYSGRGMYGKTCLALSGDFSGIALAFAFAGVAENSGLPLSYAQKFCPTRSDSFGMGTVYY